MYPLLKRRYQILQVLSDEGGFGQTFLAEDTDVPSRRRCVIKKLRPVADPTRFRFVRERFEREAAILERLGDASDQIPRLYAYFPEQQELYLVQEWIEGPTLREKVRREGALGEAAVGELLMSLLNVLVYVHEQRIIHRDIKPANIILRERDNKPVLIDFGIVKEVLRFDAEGNPTPSIIAGTPGYTPAEQALGRPVFASDLYSLGATAIFLLTRKDPPLMSDPVTGRLDWRSHAPGVSAGLAAILDKATEPLAGDRHQTADEMRRELQSLFPGGPVRVSAPLPPTEVDTVVPPPGDERLIPFKSGGRWGYCGGDRHVLIPPKYEAAGLFREGVACVKLNGKWGFLGRTGREITPFKYDTADEFHRGTARVIIARDFFGLNRRVGYIDATGQEVIPVKYPYPPYTYFSEGLISMQLNDKWGFLDQTGRVVVPFKYDAAEPFGSGRAAVQLRGRWGFIDTEGREVIPLKFYGASSYSGSLANVQKGSVAGLIKQWGFIDLLGREVIPFEYDYKAEVFNNRTFSDGLACIRRQGKFGFIDRAGELVIPFRRFSEVSPFIKGQDVAYVRLEDGDNKYGFIDKVGYETVPMKYEETDYGASIFEVVGGTVQPGRSMFHDGLARVKLNDRCGYIDKTDYEVIPLDYREAAPFSEGLACVKSDKHAYGYVDTRGHKVIPFKYSSAQPFREGLALVSRRGATFYIDKEGTEYHGL